MKGKIGIIILAAGSSSRLGRPKQLLKTGDKTLIRRICDIALSVNPQKVIVITGAYSSEVNTEIKDLPIEIIYNDSWQEGMASSIQSGLTALVDNEYDAALILLCDQLNITGMLLQQVIEGWSDQGYKLSCCIYGTQPGTPALFDKSIFSELFRLRGDKGAKSVILNHIDTAKKIEFPGGEIDIDSPGDIKYLE